MYSIVLTTRVTRIAGTVTDRRGTPVRDATGVVFPDDPAQRTTLMRFKTARLERSGQFTVSGLLPGRYLARPSATSVTLNEGDQKRVTLRITAQQAGSNRPSPPADAL